MSPDSGFETPLRELLTNNTWARAAIVGHTFATINTLQEVALLVARS